LAADADSAPHLDGHEVVCERTEQNLGEMPDKKESAHRNDKAARAISQLLELRTGLYGQVVLASDRVSAGGCWVSGTLTPDLDV
jgi:hypothetical protein